MTAMNTLPITQADGVGSALREPPSQRMDASLARRRDATYPLDALRQALASLAFDAADPAALGRALRSLIEQGLDNLPLPGHGHTLDRWRALSLVAERDLGLVKLFEGHTDALAILAELNGPSALADQRWGVFAAQAPGYETLATSREASDMALTIPPSQGAKRTERRAGGDPRNDVECSGAKAWCSGAATLTHALLTCGDTSGKPRLVAIALDDQGVRFSAQNWHAVGMAATQSGDIALDRVRGTLVGGTNAYVTRPGFAHGGAGIAACWYGGALALAKTVRRAALARCDAHLAAHLGEIDVALAGAAAVLHASARWIDAHASADASGVALRTRLIVEHSASRVLDHACRALGAGALCRDANFARCAADLPVFMRQSHGQRDLAALGTRCIEGDDSDATWAL